MDPSIWVAVISGASWLATTYITSRVSKRVGDVHEQVKNTHQTNLREDIDRMLSGLADLRADFGQMRDEVTQERYERMMLTWRVDRLAERDPE